MNPDKSTCALVPSLGTMRMEVGFSWLELRNPLNYPRQMHCVIGKEVAEAYNDLIEIALKTSCRFFLTMEDDNLPPPYGHIKLLAGLDKFREFDAISGIYHTKDEEHVPLVFDEDYRPKAVIESDIIDVGAIPMGFALWHRRLFERVRPPWFMTVDEGENRCTHDIYFARRARDEAGALFAVHTGVQVGHIDRRTGQVY